MIDFQTMETALKIAWVNRIRQNCHFSWRILIEHFFRQYGGFSFLLNCRYDLKLLYLNTVPPFYHEILKYWQENKSIISEDNIPKQNEIIWNKQNILINKHMIYLKHWHQSGITHINALPLNMLYFETVCSLMHDISTNSTPQNICDLFTCSSDLHAHITRFSDAGNLYINKSRLRIQLNSFSIFGAKLWNCLKLVSWASMLTAKFFWIHGSEQEVKAHS